MTWYGGYVLSVEFHDHLCFFLNHEDAKAAKKNKVKCWKSLILILFTLLLSSRSSRLGGENKRHLHFAWREQQDGSRYRKVNISIHPNCFGGCFFWSQKINRSAQVIIKTACERPFCLLHFISPCLHSLSALHQRIDDSRVCQGGGIADVFQITGGDFAQNPAHDFP